MPLDSSGYTAVSARGVKVMTHTVCSKPLSRFPRGADGAYDQVSCRFRFFITLQGSYPAKAAAEVLYSVARAGRDYYRRISVPFITMFLVLVLKNRSQRLLRGTDKLHY